jgi:hypothetical protein
MHFDSPFASARTDAERIADISAADTSEQALGKLRVGSAAARDAIDSFVLRLSHWSADFSDSLSE